MVILNVGCFPNDSKRDNAACQVMVAEAGQLLARVDWLLFGDMIAVRTGNSWVKMIWAWSKRSREGDVCDCRRRQRCG